MSLDLLVSPSAPSVSLSDAVRTAEPGTDAAEVVVVGTGAGGAAAGAELARAGKRVLFLEAGGAYTQRDFQKRSLSWSTAHLFAGRGPQATTGDARMVIPQGRVVGGSTVLNSGICFKPPDVRLQEWAALTGEPALLPAAMAPFVDEVWRRLGVAATHEGIGRRNNALLRDGLAKLAGVEHGWIERNAPTCLGCGVCHLGCPSGAKASVDKALLPEAANLGARILTRARADGIVVEGGRVTGVDVVVLDEHTGEARGDLRVKADLVILAGSALGSPLILEQSGAGNAERGAHLALHPGFGVLAEFEERVSQWNGVPQGYYGHVPGDDRFVIEAQGLTPTELFGVFGRAGEPEILQRFQHYALAGPMIRDVGGGTVAIGSHGDHRPAIHARLHDEDFAAFRAGAALVVRAWFAAGAARVGPFAVPFRLYDDEAQALAAVDTVKTAADILQVHASHPMGTCRMGPAEGPHRGVVDGRGRVHGVESLYVMDGSIFPTTLGVNPQITIMALATMLARRLVT